MHWIGPIQGLWVLLGLHLWHWLKSWWQNRLPLKKKTVKRKKKNPIQISSSGSLYPFPAWHSVYQSIDYIHISLYFSFHSSAILTTLHVRSWFQKLAASSKLKSVPPMGAPKAEETPDAAPPATKSRISWSFLNAE